MLPIAAIERARPRWRRPSSTFRERIAAVAVAGDQGRDLKSMCGVWWNYLITELCHSNDAFFVADREAEDVPRTEKDKKIERD